LKVLRSALSVTIVALLAVAAPVRAQTPVPGSRVAYIDLQRVLARSAAGVAAREQLERDKAGMQKDIEVKRKELETLRDELEKKGPLMTADERKRRDAARLADDFQKELEKKESVLLQKVLQDVSGVIEKVGKERGYELIIERQRAAVLYASPEADLTEEIIKAYDQQAVNKGKK
jgi:outer membrane protein